MLRSSKIMLVLLVFSFMIRLLISVNGYRNQIWNGFADDVAYHSMAQSMLEQGPFIASIETLHPTAKVVGPGISWVLAILFFLFGNTWLPVFILNAILGTAVCWIIYLLAKSVHSSSVAILALFWASIYPFYLKHIATSGKEIWLQLLVVSIVLILYQFGKKTSMRSLLGLALLYAFLLHIDERYLAYLPLIIVYIGITSYRNHQKVSRSVLAFIGLFALFLSPWTIRNYIVYDQLVLVSVRTVPVTDRLLRTMNIYSKDKPDVGYEIAEDTWKLTPAQIDSVLSGHLVTDKRGIIPEDQAEAIRRGLVPKDFTWYQKASSRFRELWDPIDIWDNYKQCGHRWDGKWSLRHNLVGGFFYGSLLIPMIMGFYLLYRRNKLGFFLFAVLGTYHSLIHVLFIPYTLYRYRIPIDFIVIICAFIPVSVFIKRYLFKRTFLARSLDIESLKHDN